MALLGSLIAIVAGASVWGLLKGHHVFAAALILIGAYELTAPGLFLIAEEDLAMHALLVFAEYASESLIYSLLVGVLWFLLIFIGVYLLSAAIFERENRVRATSDEQHGTMLSFALVLLVFGVISMWTGAGRMRLEDYGATLPNTTEYSRFLAYGGFLLVVGTGLIFRSIAARHVWTAVAVILCLIPLLIELFVAGRRQWFVPSFVLVVLAILYGSGKHKITWTLALTSVVAVAFAFQFGLREVLLQGETTIEGESIRYAVLSAQAIEFVAVGATSLYAWNFFAAGDEPLTLGFHWMYLALNAIPFVRVGDMLFPDYAETLFGIYNRVAPWGGLSTLADSSIAFGIWGIAPAAALLAVFSRLAHEYARTALINGMSNRLLPMYVLSLVATLLTKYRSGFGDALQSAISFSILYWSIALAAHFFITFATRLPTSELARESGSDVRLP